MSQALLGRSVSSGHKLDETKSFGSLVRFNCQQLKLKEQNRVRNQTYIICRKTTVPWYQSISFWKQSVSDWFVASLSMLASHLINSGYNPLLEQLDGFIKKYKQFIQSDITTDIVALTLILSTEGCGTSNFTIYFVDTSLFCFFYS